MRRRRAKPEVSEEDRQRDAVRAQLEQITQEYKVAQEQARSAAQQLKCVPTPDIYDLLQ